MSYSPAIPEVEYAEPCRILDFVLPVAADAPDAMDAKSLPAVRALMVEAEESPDPGISSCFRPLAVVSPPVFGVTFREGG